jgi:hypothetical protein
MPGSGRDIRAPLMHPNEIFAVAIRMVTGSSPSRSRAAIDQNKIGLRVVFQIFIDLDRCYVKVVYLG